jgi:hypothetical protein
MRLHSVSLAGRALAPLALLLASSGVARSDSALYKEALRSTGWVVVPQSSGLSSGACWVADRERRLAVTCRHVVGDAREVLVYFPRYEEDRPVVEVSRYLLEYAPAPGRVIATDPVRDLALLRLEVLPEGVKPMPLADRPCGPGDDIHSLGNSGLRGGFDEGTLWWYTRGSVRQVHRRRMKSSAATRSVWLVETQAPVNEGDSGGPVVDGQGRLVCVTLSYHGGERLVSQGLDVREVKAFLQEETKRIAGREKPIAPRLRGLWKFAAGTALSGTGEFRRDGTFHLRRARGPLQGRYAYANGLLWLIVKGGMTSLTPVWKGHHRFCVKLGDTEVIFDRQARRSGRVMGMASALLRRIARAQPRPGAITRADREAVERPAEAPVRLASRMKYRR